MPGDDLQEQQTTLRPEDDLPHPPGDSSSWRESVYYEFLDPVRGIGSYQYVGERPNRDRAGLALSFWVDPEQVFGRLEHGSTHRDDRGHACAGLRAETVVPLRVHHLSYDGPVVGPKRLRPGDLRLDPAAMRPGAAAALPTVGLQLDLEWTAETPALTFPASHLRTYFAGHLEQFGRVRGLARLDGRAYDVDAPGIRDRSWGERDWLAVEAYTFLWAPFPDGHLAVTNTTRAGTRELTGWVVRPGQACDVVGWEEDLDEVEVGGKPLPMRGRITLTDRGGEEHRLDVELLAAVPSIFAPGRSAGRGAPARVAWIDRCVARFRRGGEQVLGVLESQRVVPAPAPAG